MFIEKEKTNLLLRRPTSFQELALSGLAKLEEFIRSVEFLSVQQLNIALVLYQFYLALKKKKKGQTELIELITELIKSVKAEETE